MVGRILFSLLSLAVVCSAALAQAPVSGGVPRPILKKLTTGVNLTRWFCYVGDPKDTKHYQNYMTQADFDAFKRLNLGFVRLCVSPEVIYREGQPDATNLPYIDSALKRLEAAGLVTLWDLHDNGQMKLDKPGAANDGFVTFWEAIARHYKGKHENTVVFELLNEPTYPNDSQDWYRLQARTVAAIRAIDPRRTILVTGNQWGGIDSMTSMTPLSEKNLIYSYHCYDPFFFTHQGASWAGDVLSKLRQIPFPSSPEAVDAILDQNPEPFRSALRDYGKAHYDRDYLRSRIAKAADWGRKNGVPTLLGEFGAYPPVSPTESRARWFEAMRSVIAELRAPNALWGYDDALGLGRRLEPSGKLWLDPVTLQHLYHVSP